MKKIFFCPLPLFRGMSLKGATWGTSRLISVVMVIFVMAVSGQQAITKVTYRLNPAGYACGTLDSNSIPAPCNGGWDREITGSYSATNVSARSVLLVLMHASLS